MRFAGSRRAPPVLHDDGYQDLEKSQQADGIDVGCVFRDPGLVGEQRPAHAEGKKRSREPQKEPIAVQPPVTDEEQAGERTHGHERARDRGDIRDHRDSQIRPISSNIMATAATLSRTAERSTVGTTIKSTTSSELLSASPTKQSELHNSSLVR